MSTTWAELAQLHFLRPWWLLALLLVPLLAWRLRARARRRSGWREAVDAHLLPHLLEPGAAATGRAWARRLALLGLVLALLALAGPSFRKQAQPLWQSRQPLVVALDLSRAALARDLPPTRLAQARAKLATLLRERAGGQVALVAFADDAYTVAPLTDDAANVALFLDALAPDVMPADGQRVDRAIAWSQRLLQQGGDVLHIAFTSGQSCSVNNAYLAAAELKDKYPGQKLIVIDSLCSSSGYGLLVDYAADMRDAGEDIDTVAQWVLDNRNKVHHQFFSSDMTQFRRTGRVSGAAATVATVLNICPIMRLDDKGAIKAYSKVRGKKKAVETTVDTMEQHAQGGRDYDGKCFICHSQCPEDARLVMDAVEDRFPKLKGKVRLCDIGTIIGSHAGQGTVAVFFMGDERPEME